MKTKVILKTILFILIFTFVACNNSNDSGNNNPNDKEIIQLGTVYNETSVDIAKDSEGNIYILSAWEEIRDKDKKIYLADISLSKFNKNYEKVWTTTLGTVHKEYSGIFANSLTKLIIDKSDNIYVFGNTSESIDGLEREVHGLDPFFIKLNYLGEELTKRQWGGKGNDFLNSVVVDNNRNIYVTGTTSTNFNTNSKTSTQDIFITKINNNDEIEWTHFHPTDNEEVLSFVTIKGSDIYITGNTYPLNSSNNKNYFLFKFNEEENFKEISITETSERDVIKAIDVDLEGNVYITGYTEGDLSSLIPNKDGIIEKNGSTGPVDMFIFKVNDNGVENFKQWGSSVIDKATAITIDELGNIYIAGITNQNDPPGNTDNISINLTKLDKDFKEIWFKTRIALKETVIKSILLDGEKIHLTGSYLNEFEEDENQGKYDIFITIFDNKK